MDQLQPFYFNCRQCDAVIPNGLIIRRKMPTGHLTGRHGGTYYETVRLCGVCAQEIDKAERQQGQAQGKILGCILLTAALTMTGMHFAFSLPLAFFLAWRGLSSIALVSVLVASLMLDVPKLTSVQYVLYFLPLWVTVMAACVMGLQAVKQVFHTRQLGTLLGYRRAL